LPVRKVWLMGLLVQLKGILNLELLCNNIFYLKN